MKLTTEKNEELKNLSRCFEKIETLAARMGVEVEDLMQEYKNNNTASYDTFKKSLLAVAEKRQIAFNEFSKDATQIPAAGMSILKEEDEQ